MIASKNKNVDGDEEKDEEVEITFDHHCSRCDHKICTHFHSYQLDDGHHKYVMECCLCGRGALEQFAGIKDMESLQALNGNEEDDTKDAVLHEVNEDVGDMDDEDNQIQDKNKRMVLNLAAITFSEQKEQTNDCNDEVEDDEWDD